MMSLLRPEKPQGFIITIIIIIGNVIVTIAVTIITAISTGTGRHVNRINVLAWQLQGSY